VSVLSRLSSYDDIAAQDVLEDLVAAQFSPASGEGSAGLVREARLLAEQRADIAALLQSLVSQLDPDAPDLAPSGSERGWWASQPWFGLRDQTLESLRAVDDAVESCAELCAEWARLVGLDAEPTQERTWQSLLVGGVLPVELPTLDQILRRVTLLFRSRGFLPTNHRVTLIRKPAVLASSYVAPARLPGRTFLVLSNSVWASAVEYVPHELSHVAHHAELDSGVPLADRWAIDPVLSEGWALLWETLIRDVDILVDEMAFSRADAVLLARTFEYSETLNRNLFRAQVWFDNQLCDTDASPEELAAQIEGMLGLQWSTAQLVQDRSRTLQWRTYLAAYEFRDAFAQRALDKCGPRWNASNDLWERCRHALRRPGGAPKFLDEVFDG
jgi:hypothetical protein